MPLAPTASQSRLGLDQFIRGGAAAAARPQSWRDFINQQQPAGADLVPDMVGDAAGGQPWQEALGGFEEPRPEPGTDEDILARAETRQASREDLAEAVGAPGPEGGEPPAGLLTTALDYLNRPHATVLGAVSGLAGLGMGDEFDDADADPLERAATRAWAGITGEAQPRVGDEIRDQFGVDDDTPFLGRAAAGLAGFVGDVAVDPLTYVSLGGSVVGKRIAGEAVERQVAHRAQDVLSREARQQWGQRAPRWSAPRAAREGAPDESVLARQADDALARADTPPPTWHGTRDEWLEHLGDRQFSGAAAEAFQAGGPTGLRRFLKTEVGDEAGERLFRELPRDVQGGLRIRRPFSRDPETGTARAVGLGGGGRWLEQFRLDDAAMTVHQWRNRVRARGVGRYIADNMTGREGAMYGRMVESVYDRPDDFSGVAYRAMQAIKDSKREAEQYGRQIHQATQETFGRMRIALADSGDEDAAHEAMRRWAMDPAALDELRVGGVEFPDVGSARGPGLDDLDDVELAGVTAALQFHDFLRHRLEDMRRAGLSVDELNDYIPRIRTLQESELRQARKPVRQSIGMRGGEGAYDPQRMRRQYVEAFTVEGEDGLPRVEFRHLDPEEANRASGRAVFEEDPLAIVAGYGDAARRLSTRARFANLLRESGQIVEGSTQYERILAGRHVEDMVSTAQRTLDEYESTLRDAVGRAQRDVDAASSDAAEARARAARARGDFEAARHAEARFEPLSADERRRLDEFLETWGESVPAAGDPTAVFADDPVAVAGQVARRPGAVADAAARGELSDELDLLRRAIATSDPLDRPAYRGIVEGRELQTAVDTGVDFDTLTTPGATVDMPPSSFSVDEGTARGFAAGSTPQAGARRVIVEVDNPRAVAGPDGIEQEIISGGRFRVEDVRADRMQPVPGGAEFDVQRVRLRQLEPDPAPTPTPPGHTRLWRADGGEAHAGDAGRVFFTSDRGHAESFLTDERRLVYVDVPDEQVAAARGDAGPLAELQQVQGVDEVQIDAQLARQARPAQGHELADDSPLRYPRREYASEQARRRVAEAEADLDERLAQQRREYAETRLSEERTRRAAQESIPFIEDGQAILGDQLQGHRIVRTLDSAEARWFTDPESERVLRDAGFQREVYATRELPEDVAREILADEVGERAAQQALARPGASAAEAVDSYLQGYVPYMEVWQPASPEVAEESVRVAWQHLRRLGDQLSDEEYVSVAGDVMRQLRNAVDNADPDRYVRSAEIQQYRHHEPAAVIGERFAAGVTNPLEEQRRMGAVVRLADELADMGWGLRYRTAYQAGTRGDPGRPGGWRMSLDRRRTAGHEVHASRQATRDWMQRLGFPEAELPAPPQMRLGVDRRQQQQARALDELTSARVSYDHGGRRAQAVLGTRDELDDVARQLQRRLDAGEIGDYQRQTVEAALRRMRREVDTFDETYRNLSPRPDGAHVQRGLREAPPEPRLDDFLGEAPAQPGLGRAERDRMRRRLEAEARGEWDEALRGARREGAPVPEGIVESAPRSVRDRAEQARRGALAPAERAARRDTRDAARGLQRQTRELEGAELRAQRAEAELVEIQREIDRIATDRTQLAELTERVMGLEDPNERFEALDTLVDGLLDFHERAYDRYGAEIGRTVDASREALKEARRETRQRIRTISREAERARAGRTELDEVGQHYLEVGLHQIGGPRVTGPRAGRSPEDLVMPPELDISFAPEVMRDSIEKYFRASRPGTSEHFATFLDGVYRPYFQLFKATATIMRGPGYVTRNTIGGIWNNYLRDVTARDHRLSARIMLGRRRAWSDAMDEFAEQMARQQGRPVAEVRKNLPPERVAARTEQLLEQRLGGTKVGDTDLYQIHRAMQMEEVGWTDNRIFESIHGMLRRQLDHETAQFWQADPRQPFQAIDPPPQMFRHLDESELNIVQRGANRVVNNWWADMSKDWARQSEDFIRGAAFIRGVQEYGLNDGGRTAALLSRALHFDYQDLSHFEDTWMRGTLIPFYVWSRHNVPLQARALFKDPGKMHRLGLARDEMEALMGDDEFDMTPEWMQERLGFATRYRFGGSPIIVGMETPAYDLNQFLKVGRPGEAGRGMMRHLMSQVSPVFQLPVEQMLGVSTFTGAAFNPRGTEAPLWYRAIPGLPTREDEQGTVRGHAPTISAVRDAIPPLGQIERIAPTTDQYRERWPTSLVSTLAAWPTATFTPRQQAGELRARSDRLDSAATWAADQAVVDEARELLEQGLPPEQVRAVLEARYGR